MSRKEIFYTVSGKKGRDDGKVFHIQEMSASQAEWWAIRAGLAMAKNGAELPENFADMGMVGMATVGMSLIAKIPAEEAKPLLDELISCVQFVPNPQDKTVMRPLIESDIEEVMTRLKLRSEVFKLHVDFLQAAAA